MGYCTYYSFNTQDNKYPVKDIIAFIQEKESMKYVFQYDTKYYKNDESTFDFELEGEFCKWYEHDEDMLELSKRFPETVFCLYGKGEDSEDIWRTYYKNGKMQFCPARIEFDDYDEIKLV